MVRYAVLVAALAGSLFASAVLAQPASVPIASSHPAEAGILKARAKAEQPLKIHISFALRDRDQLVKLLADQQDPTSAEYHHWLKPAEFDARYGLTPAEVASVEQWLAAEGFRVTSSSSRELTATATVVQAEAAFATSISGSSDGQLFANSTNIEIPSQYSNIVAAVDGLDNLRHSSAVALTAKMPWQAQSRGSVSSPHPMSIKRSNGRKSPVMRIALKTTPEAETGGFGDAFGPADLATFYDQTPLISAGTNGGGGDCLAVIEDSDYLSGSVNLFDSTFGLPAASITRVFPDKTTPGRNGDEVEVLIDLEWAHAVARDAAIRAYIGNSASATIDPLTDSIKMAVSDNQCGAISISYGFCGASSSFYSGTLDPIFMQAAAQGQSVFVSSGDDGAAGIVLSGSGESCVRGTSPNVSEMSADPNVTGVGGTEFTPDYVANNDVGNVSESVWNDGSGASGGGGSTVFPKPSYQSSVTPDDNVRDVPDVALGASPNSPGFYLGDDSGGTATMDCCWGGTSIAAPMWAGIAKLTAEVDGARLGNMNTQIYTLGALENETASGLRDVTIGNNSFNGVTGFNAVVGYDQATGWGTADMATFVNSFTASNGGPTPTPTPSPVSGPMTVMPIGMSFGLHKLGTASRARIVTVINPKKNKQTITISSITTTGNQFTIDPTTTTCLSGQVINQGSRCKVAVIFSPTATGIQTSTLTISSNALNEPRLVILHGRGK
jgi:subtilase family serine protease